ncbi:MAG: hypothetical protein M1339_01705 [Bacteroidetes bacterium]|nr:hypothetical protein [Bacteroidota bacterium]
MWQALFVQEKIAKVVMSVWQSEHSSGGTPCLVPAVIGNCVWLNVEGVQAVVVWH